MNFKGKRSCQAPENLRGSLNFLHKRVFIHSTLLCIPPISLAPIFIMFFVCLAFLLVVVLVWGLFVCSFALKLPILSAKKALQKAPRLERHPKPGGEVDERTDATLDGSKTFPSLPRF